MSSAARTLPAMRTDYGPNRLSLRLAFRPFADAFRFKGRSTRTEVVSFWLLGIVCNLGVVRMSGLSPQVATMLDALWSALWGWPWIPLLIRRLHDQDRSGRWALLPLVGVVLFAIDWLFAPGGDGPSRTLSLGFIHDERHVAWSPLIIATGVLFAMTAIVTFLLYLAPATRGPNRYGPDPRRGAGPRLVPVET